MAFAETAQLAVRIDLEGNAAAGIRKLQGQVKGLSGTLGRAGKGVGQIGTGLAKAGTRIAAGVVVGLGAAAKAAIDWEDAFAGVVKTVDEADLSAAGLTFDDLARSLRDLSLEMPNTAQELAGIAEAAGALGIPAKDIEAFTKQVAILAATTDVSAEDAATSLGQLRNVIRLTGDEYDNFAAALVDLGNKGASTESQILEIAKRSGLTATNAGLAKDQVLAFASAAANLGIPVEQAGTSLSRMFDKVQGAFEKGSKPVQELLGLTPKQLQKSFKTDPARAISDLLREIGKLKGAEQTDFITGLFGDNVRIKNLVRGLAESIDDNLTPSLETSATAWEEAAAAQEEFDKRNATVKSAIARLKNGIIDAAVTIGEGFTPALGRAADKLAAFLKQGDNRAQLSKIGEDIGEAIDKINWDEVLDGAKQFVDVLKGALDFAKLLFDAINKLPTEVKAPAAAVIGLDKLSGGLIGDGLGNIAGAIAAAVTRGLGSKIPGVGKLFAQPVFVTNWPAGGLGGAGAGGGGGIGGGRFGVVGTALSVGLATVAIGSAIEQYFAQNEASTAHAADIADTQRVYLEQSPPIDALRTSLAGVDQGIKDFRSNPFLTIVQGEALTTLEQMRADLQAQIAQASKAEQAQRTKDDDILAETRKSVEAARRTKDDVVSATDKTKRAVAENKRATERGLYLAKAATTAGSASIVSAIYANRPVITTTVNVSATSVVKKYTTVKRYGPTGGSRDGRGASGPLEYDI